MTFNLKYILRVENGIDNENELAIKLDNDIFLIFFILYR